MNVTEIILVSMAGVAVTRLILIPVVSWAWFRWVDPYGAAVDPRHSAPALSDISPELIKGAMSSHH